MLDSELVLNEENQLKEELIDEFDVEKKGKTYSVAYLDSGDRVFGTEGWINRIRLQDGKESVADLDLSEAVSMVGDNMPKEERDWKGEQWGSNALELVKMAGPVSFTRYKGTVGEHKVQIEVWEIPDRGSDAPESTESASGSGNTQYIAEVSTKVKNFDDAAEIREELGTWLEEKGILLKEDGLKTQKVLNAFLGEKNDLR